MFVRPFDISKVTFAGDSSRRNGPYDVEKEEKLDLHSVQIGISHVPDPAKGSFQRILEAIDEVGLEELENAIGPHANFQGSSSPQPQRVCDVTRRIDFTKGYHKEGSVNRYGPSQHKFLWLVGYQDGWPCLLTYGLEGTGMGGPDSDLAVRHPRPALQTNDGGVMRENKKALKKLQEYNLEAADLHPLIHPRYFKDYITLYGADQTYQEARRLHEEDLLFRQQDEIKQSTID